MSRYLLLVIFNLPFVVAAMLSAITQFKLNKISTRTLWLRIALWSMILVGLVSASSIYDWLIEHQWTDTQSLSLFDVIQITGIVFTFYLANRTRARVDTLEARVQDLHQELSIRLSRDEDAWRK